MKPRRTPTSNAVYQLIGGTEDNDLWVEQSLTQEGEPVIISAWELNETEREAIASGATIELWVWAEGHPPITLCIGPSMESRKKSG